MSLVRSIHFSDFICNQYMVGNLNKPGPLFEIKPNTECASLWVIEGSRTVCRARIVATSSILNSFIIYDQTVEDFEGFPRVQVVLLKDVAVHRPLSCVGAEITPQYGHWGFLQKKNRMVKFLFKWCFTFNEWFNFVSFFNRPSWLLKSKFTSIDVYIFLFINNITNNTLAKILIEHP